MTSNQKTSDIVLAQAQVDPDFEHIARFQALDPGSYWRYEPVDGQQIDRNFQKGVMLLLQDVDMFDGIPHTVILRGHPRKSSDSTYKLLVEAFLRDWQFEPNGEALRMQELQELQNEINDAQQDLMAAQSNPELVAPVVAERLIKWESEYAENEARELSREAEKGIVRPAETPQDVGARAIALKHAGGRIRTDLAGAVDAQLRDSDVRALAKLAEREAVVAQVKAKWLEAKVAGITSKVTQMAPFFSEKTAVALARVRGVQAYAQDLMKGLKTLNLYTGVGVEVATLVEGVGAGSDEPLVLFQRKLFVDEELAAHADVSEVFDFRSLDEFDARLATDVKLRDSILPAPRCVVSMAIRRRDIDYGNQYANEVQNAINRQVFLLVRNGENIHRVNSAEASHESTPRLFPTNDELDRPFKGVDGSKISFKDLRFTRAAKQADDIALHYKRFLVLLCGLDHRLKLFGDFHDEGESLSFISMGFQQRHMRFIADDERGTLIGEGRPTVGEWLKSRNDFLQSGSRVLCFNNRLINEKTAPAAERVDPHSKFDRTETMAHPLNETEILIAYRDGKEHCVDVRVSREGHSYRELTQLEFNARVSLTVAQAHAPWGFLCLDAVTPEDLLYYVNNREARVQHINFIRMFKSTAALLTAQREREAAARGYLVESVNAANFAKSEDVQLLVDAAVRSWRCANRGADLPSLDDKKAFNTILSLIHSLAREDDFGQMLSVHADNNALVPLRGVLTGKNRLALYVETPAAERDERLMPWKWVTRQSLSALKTKLALSSSKYVWLQGKPNAKETDVKLWDDEKAWMNTQDEPFRPEELTEACSIVETAMSRYGGWFKGRRAGLNSVLYEDLVEELMLRVKEDRSTNIDLPIATYVKYEEYKQDKIVGIAYLCVSAPILGWVKHFGTEQQDADATERYLSHWVHPELHKEANAPFNPRFVVRSVLSESDMTPGLFMAPARYYREDSLEAAKSKVRDAQGNYVSRGTGAASLPDRSLDATLAVWMRDLNPGGSKRRDHRPDRVFLEPSLALGISSIDVNDDAAKGGIAKLLGI